MTNERGKMFTGLATNRVLEGCDCLTYPDFLLPELAGRKISREDEVLPGKEREDSVPRG